MAFANASLNNLIQQGYLQRMFKSALAPKLMFRGAASREVFPAQIGQEMTMTRRALPTPSVGTLAPTDDPEVIDFTTEQFKVRPDTFAKTTNTYLPDASTQIVNRFLEGMRFLSEHAGWSIDRVARAALYTPYSSGDCWTSAAVSASTSLPVTSLAGFTEVLDSGNSPVAVSASNPLNVTVNAVANTVIGATPDNAAWPNGPGTLTLGTAVTVAVDVRVLAANRPTQSLPTGVTTTDGIGGANIISIGQLIRARQILKDHRVPTFADGTYHMKMATSHLSALLEDSTFRQAYQGQPNTEELRMGVLVRQYGITFYECTDTPNTSNVSSGKNNLVSTQSFSTSRITSKEIGADLVNNSGVALVRSILVGQEALMEYDIPDGRFQSVVPAQATIGGYRGMWLDSGAFAAELEGITYVIAPPQDALQEKYRQSYALRAGWTAPTDEKTSPTGAQKYKRAVEIISA
jgi:hypothetical protein